MGSSPTVVHRAPGDLARARAPDRTDVRGQAGTERGGPAVVRARLAGNDQGSHEDCTTKRVTRSKVARRIERLLRRMLVGSEDCRLQARATFEERTDAETVYTPAVRPWPSAKCWGAGGENSVSACGCGR